MLFPALYYYSSAGEQTRCATADRQYQSLMKCIILNIFKFHTTRELFEHLVALW